MLEPKPIDEFIASLNERFPRSEDQLEGVGQLKRKDFLDNECVFVWSLSSGEMLFKKGFDLFGHKDEEMSFPGYTELFHPEDAPYVHKLGQGASYHALEHPGLCPDFVLYVSFRLRRADGNYAKVLCQCTCFEEDEQGLLRSAMVRLSDISFTDKSDLVGYRFFARDLDKSAFHRMIYGEVLDLFSARELEVIKGIEKEQTNPEIAKNLGISQHTVTTHRKKIFKKSGCHSAEELLHFCRKNGILF